MKRIYLGLAILLACGTVQAQYKKASFLNKSGRTYDLGFSGRFLNDGAGTVPGFYYSYGRDKGKRVFHWFDLELLAPTKFHYATVDREEPSTIVNVTGKSKVGLVYRYNFACYLTDIENADTKFKPFATIGINMLLLGGNARTYEYSPKNSNPLKYVGYDNFSCGANAGLGGIYAMTEKIGIKFMAGYNLQTQVDPTSSANAPAGLTSYKVFTNHPYVGVGFRFLMSGDDN
jgi:hypothetical protein